MSTSDVATAVFPWAEHLIQTLPILVLFPHNRCNCRCIMCDIWRLRQVREITEDDLQRHLDSLRALKVRWVVLSGGEPLMHSDLGSLCRLLHHESIRITILTTGLLLKPYALFVAENVDDVIVSLDGPSGVHDRIRAVPKAFQKLSDGVKALREGRPEIMVAGRCTVQKENRCCLRATVAAAKELRLNSISFLAADVTSEAFNRPEAWTAEQQATIALTAEEVEDLEGEIEALIRENVDDIETGVIAENPEKLRRIVSHFRAHLGQVPFIAPRCNAPWVSSVIEADGTVRPCFFHPSLGNLIENSLQAILNGEAGTGFRRRLDVSSDPVCQRCVCSLYLPEDKTEALYRRAETVPGLSHVGGE